MTLHSRLAPRHARTGSALACLIMLGACASAPDTITRYGDATTVYATGAKVAAGAPLYFSAGMTAGEGAPASMKAQALLTLKKLGEGLATAGMKPSDVLFVRAYLAPGPDGKVDFTGWNDAWAETFGNVGNPIKPARTTVAVPLLGRPSTLIEVEYVASAAPTDELFMSSDKLALPVSNPMLKPYGTKEGRIYSGMGVKPGAGYYWTAGTLSAPAKADAPATSPERFGDMKFQATSTLKRLQDNLAAVGLSFKDVIFLRAFLAPNKMGDGQYDYAGWNNAYDQFFNNPANPHKPARATVTTPSFGGPGAQIEVEVLTAFPGVPQASVNFDASTPATVNPNIKSYGAATSPIASGKALKPGSALYFSAGVLPSVDGDMKTQALSALGVLKSRMAEAGLGFKDVLFLRAYVVPEADGNFDRKGWGEAYGAFFGTADQPQKPARTTIAVHALPRNMKIEIDVIAALP
jgi:enamine deaminase RidA (YjgF/YER057c/UK114 family)